MYAVETNLPIVCIIWVGYSIVYFIFWYKMSTLATEL